MKKSTKLFLVLLSVLFYFNLSASESLENEADKFEWIPTLSLCSGDYTGPDFFGWCDNGSYYGPVQLAHAVILENNFYDGFQVGIGSLTGENFFGLLQAGGVSITFKGFYGLFQFGAIFNMVEGNFYGIAQIGGWNRMGGADDAENKTSYSLLQLGAVNQTLNNSNTVAIQAGLYNSNSRNFNGIFQIGAYNRVDMNSYGVQIGGFNDSRDVYGLQIGIVNRTKTLHGVQIGLLNFAKNGLCSVFPIINAGW